MSWRSIEEAAGSIGISERQAWRWLGKGKIKKAMGEDGQAVFILTDIPDPSVTDMAGDTSVTPPSMSVPRRGDARDLTYHPFSKERQRESSSLRLNLVEDFFQLHQLVKDRADIATLFFQKIGHRLQNLEFEESLRREAESWSAWSDVVGDVNLVVQDPNVALTGLQEIFPIILNARHRVKNLEDKEIAHFKVRDDLDDPDAHTVEDLKTKKRERDELLGSFDKVLKDIKSLIVLLQE